MSGRPPSRRACSRRARARGGARSRSGTRCASGSRAGWRRWLWRRGSRGSCGGTRARRRTGAGRRRRSRCWSGRGGGGPSWPSSAFTSSVRSSATQKTLITWRSRPLARLFGRTAQVQFTSILQWLSYISYICYIYDETDAPDRTQYRVSADQHLRERRRRDSTLQNSNATGARRAHAQRQPTSAQGGGGPMACSAACPAYYTVDTPYPVYDSPRITSVSPGCLIEWYLAP